MLLLKSMMWSIWWKYVTEKYDVIYMMKVCYWKVWCELYEGSGTVYVLDVHYMIERETENVSHAWKITLKWRSKINWITVINKKRTSLNTLLLSGPMLYGVLCLPYGFGYIHLFTSTYRILFPVPVSLCYTEFYPLLMSKLMIWLTWIFEYEMPSMFNHCNKEY